MTTPEDPRTQKVLEVLYANGADELVTAVEILAAAVGGDPEPREAGIADVMEQTSHAARLRGDLLKPDERRDECPTCHMDWRELDRQWSRRWRGDDQAHERTKVELAYALNELRDLRAASGVLPEQPQTPCIGNDPACPCQDGDTCHYVDDPLSETLAWPLPEQPQPAEPDPYADLGYQCGHAPQPDEEQK